MMGSGTLADRVFAASRTHLAAASESAELEPSLSGQRDETESLAHIGSIAPLTDGSRRSGGVWGNGFGFSRTRTAGQAGRGGRGAHRLWSAASVRWARVALATAAAVAVAAGSWIAIQPDTAASSSTGRSMELAEAGSSASSVAELTLVALLDGRQSPEFGWAGGMQALQPRAFSLAGQVGMTRTWLNEDRLGGSDAARMAVPVLRTQGSAIDDIESELGAILGLSQDSFSSLDGAGFDDGYESGFDTGSGAS